MLEFPVLELSLQAIPLTIPGYQNNLRDSNVTVINDDINLGWAWACPTETGLRLLPVTSPRGFQGFLEAGSALPGGPSFLHRAGSLFPHQPLPSPRCYGAPLTSVPPHPKPHGLEDV